MNAREYESARAALGFTHKRMTEELGISMRQSFRYASGHVVPLKVERLIRSWLRYRTTMSHKRFEKRMSEL